MLKSIEIKNFESHKHTVIKDFSEGLNLFRGESMAGKTSIIRALKLAAYNQFEPKSLRTGETKCEVIVTTDKGTVEVHRGPKINFWKITPLGQPPLTFDKVGKNIIPEAARIIGLNIVRLGDADIPVNIMDQLESHFMLKSIAGEEVSGSLRAQVIDEISGLSGIEGVIKAVSLDNHRFGREIKENEDKMGEAQAQMHDEQALVQEQSTLESAEQTLKHHDDCLKASIDAQALLDGYNRESEEFKTAEDAIMAIPDVDNAKAHLDNADVSADRARQAGEIYEAGTSTGQKIADVENSLNAIPDAEQALTLTTAATDSLTKAEQMQDVLDDYQRVAQETAQLNADVETLEQMGDPTAHIEAAKTALEAVTRCSVVQTGAKTLQGQITALEGRIRLKDTELKKAEADRDAILAQVKVCPLTLKPVSKECLEGAK